VSWLRPRNSPTTSIVSTSGSDKIDAGPRWRKGFPGKRVFNVSSMRQNTAMINTSRSTTHLHGKSLSLIKRRHGLDFQLKFEPILKTCTSG